MHNTMFNALFRFISKLHTLLFLDLHSFKVVLANRPGVIQL